MAKKPSVKRIFEDELESIIINGKKVDLRKPAINKKKAEALLRGLKAKNNE